MVAEVWLSGNTTPSSCWLLQHLFAKCLNLLHESLTRSHCTFCSSSTQWGKFLWMRELCPQPNPNHSPALWGCSEAQFVPSPHTSRHGLCQAGCHPTDDDGSRWGGAPCRSGLSKRQSTKSREAASFHPYPEASWLIDKATTLGWGFSLIPIKGSGHCVFA